MKKPETYEKAKEMGLFCFSLSKSNKDWAWVDEEGYFHFMRDGKDLLKGKKVIGGSHNNNGWIWQGEDGEWHKVKGGEK